MRNEAAVTAAEVTRYFIRGETGRPVRNNAQSEWRISKENDGRIPCMSILRLTTAASGETANVFTKPTDASGAWTADKNVGSVANASAGTVTMRRAGTISAELTARLVNACGSALLRQLPNIAEWRGPRGWRIWTRKLQKYR